MPNLICYAATYRFQDIRGQNLGFWGTLGAPGDTFFPRSISTIMQNFTPIGVTVAEISVNGQIHRYNYSKENDQTKRILGLRLSIKSGYIMCIYSSA